MERKSITCILCPRGCDMSILQNENNEIEVKGNACGRGKEYAIEELTAPKRVITSTIKIINGNKKMLPIKTDKPILKKNIMKYLDIIYRKEIEAPVKVGQIIIENIDGSGANIVATSEDSVNEKSLDNL